MPARLVRDEGAHLLRMRRDQRQRIDRAATAGEQVDGAGVELGDQPAQVVGVLLRRGRACRIVLDAALDATWVVGDHGAITEVTGQRGVRSRPSAIR